MIHVLRFVRENAPKGFGRQIRAVRLRQNTVRGDGFCAFVYFFRVLERRSAAEGKIHSQRGKLPYHFRRIGIAVHESAPFQERFILFQDFQRIRRRVAAVNDDGKPRFVRDFQLSDKDFFLQFAVGIVGKMVIQPDFSYRDAFRMRGKAGNFREVSLLHSGQFLGLKSRRKVYVGILLGKFFRRQRGFEVEPRTDHRRNARRARPFQNGGQAARAVVFPACQVAMHVYRHNFSLSG